VSALQITPHDAMLETMRRLNGVQLKPTELRVLLQEMVQREAKSQLLCRYCNRSRSRHGGDRAPS
jgi:hypothetical protein